MQYRFFGTANMLECLKEAEVVDEPIITKVSTMCVYIVYVHDIMIFYAVLIRNFHR